MRQFPAENITLKILFELPRRVFLATILYYDIENDVLLAAFHHSQLVFPHFTSCQFLIFNYSTYLLSQIYFLQLTFKSHREKIMENRSGPLLKERRNLNSQREKYVHYSKLKARDQYRLAINEWKARDKHVSTRCEIHVHLAQSVWSIIRGREFCDFMALSQIPVHRSRIKLNYPAKRSSLPLGTKSGWSWA